MVQTDSVFIEMLYGQDTKAVFIFTVLSNTIGFRKDILVRIYWIWTNYNIKDKVE